jgi:hypothetical protein
MMRVFTISAQIIARNLKEAIELTLFPAPAVRCHDRDRWMWILFLFTKFKKFADENDTLLKHEAFSIYKFRI